MTTRKNYRSRANLEVAGQLDWTYKRRSVALHEPAIFDWLVAQATEKGVGIGNAVAEIVEQAFLQRGPHS